MNMFKKNEGFTLVELIVVIAILAILAGVAVPAYSGYITKANEAADMTWLDSAKTAIVFAVAEKDPAAQVKGATITFAKAGTEGAAGVAFAATADYVDGDGEVVEDETVVISEFVDTAYSPKSKAASATWDGEKWELN